MFWHSAEDNGILPNAPAKLTTRLFRERGIGFFLCVSGDTIIRVLNINPVQPTTLTTGSSL